MNHSFQAKTLFLIKQRKPTRTIGGFNTCSRLNPFSPKEFWYFIGIGVYTKYKLRKALRLYRNSREGGSESRERREGGSEAKERRELQMQKDLRRSKEEKRKHEKPRVS